MEVNEASREPMNQPSFLRRWDCESGPQRSTLQCTRGILRQNLHVESVRLRREKTNRKARSTTFLDCVASNDASSLNLPLHKCTIGLAGDLMETERELPLALRAAYLALHRKTDARFAEHRITADQFVLLASLSDGQALTQRELAERISSDPSTVRAMLVLLEGNGFVKRDSHPTDARAKTVALTAAGKRMHKKLWKAGQSIRDDMCGCMSTEDADTLLVLLRKLAGAINDEAVVA